LEVVVMEPARDPSFAPSATVTLEPRGPRGDGEREHVVRVSIKLREGDGSRGDARHVAEVTRAALAPFVHDIDRRTIDEVCSKPVGKIPAKVMSIEGAVIERELPADDLLDRAVAVLIQEGYSVAVMETRECREATCLSSVVMSRSQRATIPRTWHATDVCGRHHYKVCASCNSTYLMSSSNAAGQAESLHCEVCGVIMIEWGGSKVWSAELVTRGATVAAAKSVTAV
jgi:hypothetical protein